MATIRRQRLPIDNNHHHLTMYDEQGTGHSEEETEDAMDESRDPLEESGCTHSDESEEDVDDAVLEDIQNFEQSFRNISQRYRLINRIGEGMRISSHYTLDHQAHHSVRHVLDSIQGRRPHVRQLPE